MLSAATSRKRNPKIDVPKPLDTSENNDKNKPFFSKANGKRLIRPRNVVTILFILYITLYIANLPPPKEIQGYHGITPQNVNKDKSLVDENAIKASPSDPMLAHDTQQIDMAEISAGKASIERIKEEFYERYGGKDAALNLLSKGIISPGGNVKGSYTSKDIEVRPDYEHLANV